MAFPCRLCNSESEEQYGPFFHRVWCKNDKCPRFTKGMFYVQWQDDNDPDKIMARAMQTFARKVLRAWKPDMDPKQLNDVLYGLTEDVKDLLYPMDDQPAPAPGAVLKLSDLDRRAIEWSLLPPTEWDKVPEAEAKVHRAQLETMLK